MALPDISYTITDNALGLVPAGGDGSRTQLKIGISQKGTVRTIYAFSDIQTLYTTLGDGPLTEAAALTLAVAGSAGGPVLCMPATIIGAGACGSVSHTGTGSAVVAAAGAAYDSYSVVFKVITGAANLAAAAAQYQVSLDGGLTFTATQAVPTSGSIAIPNTNITLTITDGTFVAADTYTFTSTAPTFDSTELTACVNAALATSNAFFLIHVVGPAASAAGAASIAASLSTLLGTAQNAFRFCRGLIEVPSDTDANILTAFVSTFSNKVMAAAGFESVISPVSGRQISRSVAWTAAARASAVAPSEDLGRVATGSCPGVTAISRDERATPNLDARFCTMRTIIGRGGFWVTNGRMLSQSTSDFQYLQYGRVMDLACATTYQSLLNYLNASVRVDGTGKILEQDAQTIEAAVTSSLNTALLQPKTNDGQGYASAVSVVVDRTANILSTQTLPVTVRVRPRGYAKFITVNIGFSNPALTVAAA